MTAYNSEYNEKVRIAWENFIAYKSYDYSFIRSEVYDSWMRSRNLMVDPVNVRDYLLPPAELNRRINANLKLIKIVRPYMRALYSAVDGKSCYLILFDSDGYLLDILGNKDMIEKCNKTNLVAGANRSEYFAGTNAFSLCYALKQPVHVYGCEHYVLPHQDFSCCSAPIFAPHGDMIACINITSTLEEWHPHTFGMIMAAASFISEKLKFIADCRIKNELYAQRDSIIESMPSGIILLNNSNEIIQINQSALRMLNLRYSDVKGKEFSDVIHSSCTADKRCDIFKKEQYNKETDFIIKDSNGSPVLYNMSVNFVQDSAGKRTGTLIRLSENQNIHTLASNSSGYKASYNFSSIIGDSPAIMRTKDLAQKASRAESNVLLLGESGTGKELFAHSIHNASKHAKGPFVPINCGSLPKSLIESELFGYEKGAFTGAKKEGNPGKFELADGGTLFLDEIGDMPYELQSSLLRVLESKEICRIGSKYQKKIDVRVIAATNRDLLESVKNKTFREDLYYRLNVFTVEIPPLRERGRDIINLADCFLSNYNTIKNTDYAISDEVYELLLKYRWPGNVRELENVLERAFNITASNIIYPACLPAAIAAFETGHHYLFASGSDDYSGGYKVPTMSDAEKILILKSLKVNKGNVKKAAEELKISRKTFYRKLEKYNINSSYYKNNL